MIEVDVVATNTFLSWLFMFGDKVEIVEPQSLRCTFEDMINKIISMYKM